MVLRLEAVVVLLLSLFSVACFAERDIFDLGEESFQPVDLKGQVNSTYIRDVVQDKAGFMWIGTENGLYRYDGYEFRHFRHDINDPTSVGGDFVYALFAADDGKVWVSTTSMLSAYEPNTEQFQSYQHDAADPKSLINNEINVLKGAVDGGLWIGTYEGLDYLAPGSKQFKHFPHEPDNKHSLSAANVYSLILDRDNDLYIGTTMGLNRLKNGQDVVERLSLKGSLAGMLDTKTIRDLHQDSLGTMWFGSANGGLFWMGEDGILDKGHATWAEFEQLETGHVRKLMETAVGEVWASTFSNGVAVLDARSGQLLRKLAPVPGIKQSLQSVYVQSMMKDESGLLWLSHRQGNGGLDIFNTHNKTSRMIYFEPGNSARIDVRKINKVLQLRNGQLWFGGAGIGAFDPETGTIPLTPGMKRLDKRSRSGNEVGAMIEDEAGLIWVMFLSNGIESYDPVTDTSHFYDQAEHRCLEVQLMVYEAPNSLWLACNEQPALIHLDTATKKATRYELTEDQIIKFSKNNALVIDQQGTAWLGTEHGLFFLLADQRDSSTALTKSRLFGHHINNLLVDHAGSLWVDDRSGLYVRNDITHPLKFTLMSEVFGLPQESLFGGNMIEASMGEIWGDYGVLNTSSGRFTPVGEADGILLAQNWPRSSMLTEQGTLLMGSSSGLLMLKPDRFKPWTYEPRLVISKLRIDDESIPAHNRGSIKIASDVKSWSVEVAALDFSAPLDNRYKYRLLGFDDSWTETSADYRQIVYRKLPPGEYELQVQGSNRLGKFSRNMIRLPVIVMPNWYQMLWFKILSAALVLLFIYGAYEFRVRQINANRKVLQNLVQVRTEELDDRNHDLEAKTVELSTAMEELIRTQEQLIANEKMASLGLLVAGVAHEVNTPLGVGVTAASHLVDITTASEKAFHDGSLTETKLLRLFGNLKSSGDILLSNLNRAAHLIHSFKGVAVDQNIEEASTFFLKAYFEKVLVSLSPSTKQHGVSVSLQCDSGWQFFGSKSAFSQIFTNLIMNSIKHGFEGTGPGEINIEVTSTSKLFLIRFSDNGAGMSEAVRKKIFDPFFTTSAQNDGTGLGLSIVYNLVTQTLKGRIQCESTVGVGTTFSFEFPNA